MKYCENRPKHNKGGNHNPVRGEVWFAFVRFQNGGGKERPVVILSTDGDRVLVRPCTSQSEGMKQRTELISPMEAGLDDKSSFVVNESLNLSKTSLRRKLGVLCPEDRGLLKI